MVLTTENDDELDYLLSKLERSRDKILKALGKGLREDFFAKSNGDEACPPVTVVQTNKPKDAN